MSKQKCANCGTEFSELLSVCPNCRHSVKQPEEPNVGAVETKGSSFSLQPNLHAEKILTVCSTIVYCIAWLHLGISIVIGLVLLFIGIPNLTEDNPIIVTGFFRLSGGWIFLITLIASLYYFILWAVLRLFVNMSINLYLIRDKIQ